MSEPTTDPADRMTVEIWSDVVCPWCYIGKRRFEAALSEFEHADAVEVLWRSFELDPNAPPESGESLDAHLAHKYGRTLEEAAEMNRRVSELAATEGLEFRLEQAQHGNTFDAHRLLHLAHEHGRRPEAKERLLRAYFTEGRAVSDADILVELLHEVGVPAEDVREALASDAHAEDVRADEARARRLGVTGVPFFALDGRYGLAGAQPVATMVQALRQSWRERSPLRPLGADGAAREDVGRAVDDG